MKHYPIDIGLVHFVGIGGIGMSGIAEIMHSIGFKIQGSDMTNNSNVKRLKEKGITIHIGHKAENLENVSAIVTSTAIKEDNIEVITAIEKQIPVLHRSDMLAELMRLKWSVSIAGTHGKTTTTSLVSNLFEIANMDPTVINGGIINSLGTNAKLGKGKWIIAEADESDNSFNKLPTNIAVVTNIEPEHLELHGGSFNNLKQAFLDFINKVPLLGFAVLCIDHPNVQALLPKIKQTRYLTYGLSSNADIQAHNIKEHKNYISYDVRLSNKTSSKIKEISNINLSMHGHHNILNSLTVIAIGLELGIDIEIIKKSLNNFSGVKRRFTQTGCINGVTIIDDYGHHPTEIKAVLSTARQIVKKDKVIAVFQPHKYTRLQNLFNDFAQSFNDANTVIVSNVYEAGEKSIDGINKEEFAKALKLKGHKDVVLLEDPKDLARIVKEKSTYGDMVVCLGAGSITNWANSLPTDLGNME